MKLQVHSVYDCSLYKHVQLQIPMFSYLWLFTEAVKKSEVQASICRMINLLGTSGYYMYH
jgi:hypothetical protein